MPTPEMRRRASASVSRMFLRTLQAMTDDFAEKNLSGVIPELLIAMVIRLNDDQGQPPASISQITRLTGIPRPTARRYVERLIERGVVIRKDNGIVGSDAYLLERIDAPYFKLIVAAIREAARELEGFA